MLRNNAKGHTLKENILGKIKLIVGLLFVVAAIAVAVVYVAGNKNSSGVKKPKTKQTVVIRYGSEKKGLLHDEEFKKFMLDKYNIVIEGTKMGSLEMMEGSMQGIDALWPSSALAAEMFKTYHQNLNVKTSNIFNTPIVFYSWPKVVEALIAQKIVDHRGGTYFVIDAKRYFNLMVEKKPWKDFGLERQNGNIAVVSTDPAKSNSGFLTSALLAIMLNDGNMVDETSIGKHLDSIYKVYQSMGFLERSTGILFDKYLKQGQGAFPVISGYENLLIEFYLANPQAQEYIKKLVRVMIPEPTVWSEHPVIALTKKGEILMNALQSKEVQQLAWRKYGFRSGVIGVNNDPAILKTLGLPVRIESVTPLPSVQVMQKILTILHK